MQRRAALGSDMGFGLSKEEAELLEESEITDIGR
jgi:hypothetical protein